MPNTVELQYRKPNQIKQDYAPRIDQQQWQYHEGTVRYLHEQGKTRKEIIEHLLEAHAFNPTLAQLNAQMRRWELKVYGKSDAALREIVDAMPLGNLPGQEALSMSEALCPMDTAEDCVDPLPETVLRYSNLGIDQNTLSVPQNGDNRVERTTESVHEFHQQPDVATSLIAEPPQDVPEMSMITFTPEYPQLMSVCGRSSTSHCTRSTFATHASDTSSLRDFRATAARAYHASVSRFLTRAYRSTHAYRRSYMEEVIRLLHSWVFIVADAEMLRKLYVRLYKAAAMIGRCQLGCICKSELPRLTRPLQGSDQQYLEGLMEDLSRLQTQDFFPADEEHISSRGRGRSSEQCQLGDCTPYPVIAKFDAFFAQMGCLYCLLEKLDHIRRTYPYKCADPDCLECKEGVGNIPRGIATFFHFTQVFIIFCKRILMELSPSPWDPEFFTTEQLQHLYEQILDLRAQLLRSHQPYEHSESQAET